MTIPVRDQTRHERYEAKRAQSRNFPVSLVTVEFHGEVNLAVAMRAAACFGANSVHVIGSVMPHADLKRVSGSTQDLTPLIQHSTPSDFLSWRRMNEPDSVLIAADLGDGAVPLTSFDFDFNRHTYLVMGNETIGIPVELTFRADHLLYIPMPGLGFCLNTSQAANVFLFEYTRQWLQRSGAPAVSKVLE